MVLKVENKHFYSYSINICLLRFKDSRYLCDLLELSLIGNSEIQFCKVQQRCVFLLLFLFLLSVLCAMLP